MTPTPAALEVATKLLMTHLSIKEGARIVQQALDAFAQAQVREAVEREREECANIADDTEFCASIIRQRGSKV